MALSNPSAEMPPPIDEGQDIKRPRWRGLLLWTIFCMGLLVQIFVPHLKIQNNAFLIPPSLISQRQEINPAGMIARERRMQWLSVILTVGGAVGLAFYYRRVFVRSRSR